MTNLPLGRLALRSALSVWFVLTFAFEIHHYHGDLTDIAHSLHLYIYAGGAVSWFVLLILEIRNLRKHKR